MKSDNYPPPRFKKGDIVDPINMHPKTGIAYVLEDSKEDWVKISVIVSTGATFVMDDANAFLLKKVGCSALIKDLSTFNAWAKEVYFKQF